MKISNPFRSSAAQQAGAVEPRPGEAPRARGALRSLGDRLSLRRRDPSIASNRPANPEAGARGPLGDLIGMPGATRTDAAAPNRFAEPSIDWHLRPGAMPPPRGFRLDVLPTIEEVDDDRETKTNEPVQPVARPRGGAVLTRQKAVRPDRDIEPPAARADLGWPLLKPSIASKLAAVTADTSVAPAAPSGPAVADAAGSSRAGRAGSVHDAWSAATFPRAKAAIDRLRRSATARPAARIDRLNDHLALASGRLTAHAVVSGEGAHVTLSPGRALIDGVLARDTMIELSPDRLREALAIKHPEVATLMPDLTPRVRVISPDVAAHLASAREVIDLVKALMPAGAGNQIKDIAASEGESALRSSLSYAYSGSASNRAGAGIRWQGGYCDAQAALAYALLAQNPDLKASRIDLVDGGKGSQHVFAVIRGRTRDRDIVVDPWASFATPSLTKDALKMHKDALKAKGGIRESKPAGTVAPAMDVEGARERQALVANASTISERFTAEKSRLPEEQIASSLSNVDRWDVPLSGNPNVRYEVQDAKGNRLTRFPLRFDLQRVRAAEERRSTSSPDGPLYVPRARREPDASATSATPAAQPPRPTRMPEDLWPRFEEPRSAADKPAA